MVKMAKYGHFVYFVEYSIWVSIKRYWLGKLALACQNVKINSHINENSKKYFFTTPYWACQACVPLFNGPGSNEASGPHDCGL